MTTPYTRSPTCDRSRMETSYHAAQTCCNCALGGGLGWCLWCLACGAMMKMRRIFMEIAIRNAYYRHAEQVDIAC